MTDTPKHASPFDSIRSTVARASDEVDALTRSERSIRTAMAGALRLVGDFSWADLIQNAYAVRGALTEVQNAATERRQELAKAIGSGPGVPWDSLLERVGSIYEGHAAARQDGWISLRDLREALGEPFSDWGPSAILEQVVTRLETAQLRHKWLQSILAVLFPSDESMAPEQGKVLGALAALEALLSVASAAEAFETAFSRRAILDVPEEEFGAFRALTRALNAPALSGLANRPRASSGVLQATAGEAIAKGDPVPLTTSAQTGVDLEFRKALDRGNR